MIDGRPKPRYSEQIESGVLCFVAWGKCIEKYGAVNSVVERVKYVMNTDWGLKTELKI